MNFLTWDHTANCFDKENLITKKKKDEEKKIKREKFNREKFYSVAQEVYERIIQIKS